MSPSARRNKFSHLNGGRKHTVAALKQNPRQSEFFLHIAYSLIKQKEKACIWDRWEMVCTGGMGREQRECVCLCISRALKKQAHKHFLNTCQTCSPSASALPGVFQLSVMGFKLPHTAENLHHTPANSKMRQLVWYPFLPGTCCTLFTMCNARAHTPHAWIAL